MCTRYAPEILDRVSSDLVIPWRSDDYLPEWGPRIEDDPDLALIGTAHQLLQNGEVVRVDGVYWQKHAVYTIGNMYYSVTASGTLYEGPYAQMLHPVRSTTVSWLNEETLEIGCVVYGRHEEREDRGGEKHEPTITQAIDEARVWIASGGVVGTGSYRSEPFPADTIEALSSALADSKLRLDKDLTYNGVRELIRQQRGAERIVRRRTLGMWLGSLAAGAVSRVGLDI